MSSIDMLRCNYFWMPVEDPVFSGDHVRHDGFGTFYEAVNFRFHKISF